MNYNSRCDTLSCNRLEKSALVIRQLKSRWSPGICIILSSISCNWLFLLPIFITFPQLSLRYLPHNLSPFLVQEIVIPCFIPYQPSWEILLRRMLSLPHWRILQYCCKDYWDCMYELLWALKKHYINAKYDNHHPYSGNRENWWCICWCFKAARICIVAYLYKMFMVEGTAVFLSWY